ncbi:hypothetical protein A2635_04720 [Candidatus Peribacteria bacterium RIFCSPHIGHO2_01_FULL_51_9]|nr:MAG: hypothetical protein A2635_04720 [Candidatus Peribacteria bacterium RIFCSPHIGHO2_01_FULL_51_9]
MRDVLLDFFFPRRSLRGELGTWITAEERSRLTTFPMRIGRAQLEGEGIFHLDLLVAAGTYAHSPLLRRAIYTLKYGKIPDFAQDLGKLLCEVFPLLATDFSQTVLCPVPLHWTRRFTRGFNQASVLAEVVSRTVGISCRELLRRRVPTGFQARRSRDERQQAMERVFAFVGREIPSCVVLVDDISTSGATLDACAKVLKERGVKIVKGLVIARG